MSVVTLQEQVTFEHFQRMYFVLLICKTVYTSIHSHV